MLDMELSFRFNELRSVQACALLLQSMFTSLLRESMRRLGAAVPAHVRRVRLRGLLALRPSLDSLATAGKHALRRQEGSRITRAS